MRPGYCEDCEFCETSSPQKSYRYDKYKAWWCNKLHIYTDLEDYCHKFEKVKIEPEPCPNCGHAPGIDDWIFGRIIVPESYNNECLCTRFRKTCSSKKKIILEWNKAVKNYKRRHPCTDHSEK